MVMVAGSSGSSCLVDVVVDAVEEGLKFVAVVAPIERTRGDVVAVQEGHDLARSSRWAKSVGLMGIRP